MSVESMGSDLLDSLARLSRQQWTLRATIPAAVVGVLVLERAAGSGSRPWFVVAALVLSLVAAVLPDSSAPLFLILLLGLHWAVVVPEQLSGWVLLAGLALTLLHTAAALASYGPASLVLDRVMLRLWTGRVALMSAVMVLVWLLAKALSALALPQSVLVFGGALAATVAWVAYLGYRLAAPSSPSG